MGRVNSQLCRFHTGRDRITSLERQKYSKNCHEMLQYFWNGWLEQDNLMTIGDNRWHTSDNNIERCKNVNYPLVALWLRCHWATFCWGVLVISLLFVAPLSLTLYISPLQSPFFAPLLRDTWEIVKVSLLCCCNLFLHVSRVTHTQVLLNCASTIVNNRARVHLVERMKIFFSLSWI